MYCSSCGIEVTKELNYCNRCGANLNPPVNQAPQIYTKPPKLTGPTIALGMTVVFSVAAIFNGAINLAQRNVHPTAITWMVIIGLATVFGVVALMVNFWATLAKNSSGIREEQPPSQLKRPQPNPQLQAAETGPMNAPVSSVTDHTTRTFEPAYRKRGK